MFIMRSIKIIVCAALALLCASGCKKDSITPSLVLSRTALYFSDWGAEPQTLTYVPTDAVQVAVSSITSGWSASVNHSTCTVTIAPPASEELGYEKTGMVLITALSKDSVSKSYSIDVYICDVASLDEAGSANCYVVTEAGKNYRFAPQRPDGSLVEATSVKLLWQNYYGLIENPAIDSDGLISFFAYGEDPGNALIAAYDAAGNVVWSWHIWVTSENPLTDVATYSNGKCYMTRNLGAYTNSNGSTDTQKIHDSYGLYYQWGRKDPFRRPVDYKCSGGVGEDVVTLSGGYAETTVEQTSATVGTVEYATAHPTVFIANEAAMADGEARVADWLAVPNSTLWGDGVLKSNYDPCPAGWRVPTAEELAVLSLSEAEDATDLNVARQQYGWHLTDHVGNYFYTGAGYYRYNDGALENMNYKADDLQAHPEPWQGYYWSSTAAPDGRSQSLFFELTTSRLINKCENNYPSYRANGMQVRCVKM